MIQWTNLSWKTQLGLSKNKVYPQIVSHGYFKNDANYDNYI